MAMPVKRSVKAIPNNIHRFLFIVIILSPFKRKNASREKKKRFYILGNLEIKYVLYCCI